MVYSYYFTAQAEADLDGILKYIVVELSNRTAASALLSKIFDNIDTLLNFPETGLIVENDFLTDKSVRRLIIDNYVLYYKAVEDEKRIYIIRIVYGKSNLNEILSSLNPLAGD